ncbi:synaptotagmin-17-like [Portunus trituberculatus]|uniref:synaptotagmin-17-like n=1 Tax=Portunus trituberculatus TaxID=210409 RepID=UPI001E1CFE0A|nr:synaptotagmin-17-like [Portunus trituberculatus]
MGPRNVQQVLTDAEGSEEGDGGGGTGGEGGGGGGGGTGWEWWRAALCCWKEEHPRHACCRCCYYCCYCCCCCDKDDKTISNTRKADIQYILQMVFLTLHLGAQLDGSFHSDAAALIHFAMIEARWLKFGIGGRKPLSGHQSCVIGVFRGSSGNRRRMRALRGMSGHRGKNFEPVQNFQPTGRQMSNSGFVGVPCGKVTQGDGNPCARVDGFPPSTSLPLDDWGHGLDDAVKELPVHPGVILVQVWVLLIQFVHEGVVVSIPQSFLEPRFQSCLSGHHNRVCVSPALAVKDLKSDIYHQIELRRSNSVSSRQLPVIDVRPIEFWSGVRGEGVQPRLPGPVRSPVAPRSPRWSSKATECESLTKIRPHLYASTSSSLEEGPDEDQLGRIHFSLHYDALAAVLRVKVIEAMDLPRPACKDRNDLAHSNPYVKVSLLPDTKNSLQTSVKKKTQDPLFEETFTFEVPYKEVVRRTLELKVKDFDKFSRHCVVGHALLPLQKVNLARSSRHWQPLTPCNLETEEYGEILLSLNYLPTAGRLNVDVIKAKQLLQTNLVRGADPYVRVSLVVRGRHLKSKKTSVRKNTLTPSFNESFSFHVTSSELREASLVITAWDWNGGVMRDEFIGRAVLGKQPSGPNEMTHWTNMMGSQRHAVAQWHSLHARSHCDQVSSASRAVP